MMDESCWYFKLEAEKILNKKEYLINVYIFVKLKKTKDIQRLISNKYPFILILKTVNCIK